MNPDLIRRVREEANRLDSGERMELVTAILADTAAVHRLAEAIEHQTETLQTLLPYGLTH